MQTDFLILCSKRITVFTWLLIIFVFLENFGHMLFLIRRKEFMILLIFYLSSWIYKVLQIQMYTVCPPVHKSRADWIAWSWRQPLSHNHSFSLTGDSQYQNGTGTVPFRVPWDLQTPASLVSLATHSQQHSLHPYEDSQKLDDVYTVFHNSYCIIIWIVQHLEKINKNPVILSPDITDINIATSFLSPFLLTPPFQPSFPLSHLSYHIKSNCK